MLEAFLGWMVVMVKIIQCIDKCDWKCRFARA